MTCTKDQVHSIASGCKNQKIAIDLKKTWISSIYA